MADLVLLHTSEAHVARFEALRDDIAPGAVLQHHVRPDWLEQARTVGLSAPLRAAFAGFVATRSAPVLCTCTSLGPLADDSGAHRVDRPMMQAAARLGGPVAMAYCLDSTRAPSLALLADCMAAAGNRNKIRPLEIPVAWPAFAAGDEARFARVIARAVRLHLVAFPDTGAVVLAQVSMTPAADLLSDTDAVVLTSPGSALRAALAPARQPPPDTVT